MTMHASEWDEQRNTTQTNLQNYANENFWVDNESDAFKW
jgi:hypothetical protein